MAAQTSLVIAGAVAFELTSRWSEAASVVLAVKMTFLLTHRDLSTSLIRSKPGPDSTSSPTGEECFAYG